MEKKQSFFDGGFGKYLLPGVILQSVLIGGGYATGREIVEFGGKFGAYGWVAGLGIFIGFTIISILTFEIARLFKAYNYKDFIKTIAGPLWIGFDIIYLLLSILVIAVMASATGEIVQLTIGLPYWSGVAILIVIVAILNFFGSWIIERFETYGTVALYLGYITFGFIVISSTGSNISRVFSTADMSFSPSTIPAMLWTGLVYVGYNIVVFPATFFTLKRQTSRKETVLSGIFAGLLMTIPWFITYFALMGFYPNKDILGASVPWLVMMQDVSPWIIGFFGIVVGWTLIETSTGIIHAAMERIDAGLIEYGKNALNPTYKIVLTIAFLLTSTIFAKVGIISLIAKGYTLMAYGMIAVYIIPIVTIGVYKIVTFKKVRQENEKIKVANGKSL